jgi:hypothetical protein
LVDQHAELGRHLPILAAEAFQPSAGGQTVIALRGRCLETVVRDLRSRGVVFDDYETPKTVDGIAQFGPVRAA